MLLPLLIVVVALALGLAVDLLRRRRRGAQAAPRAADGVPCGNAAEGRCANCGCDKEEAAFSYADLATAPEVLASDAAVVADVGVEVGVKVVAAPAETAPTSSETAPTSAETVERGGDLDDAAVAASPKAARKPRKPVAAKPIPDAVVAVLEEVGAAPPPKRGRGRPRKTPLAR
jgi:hypothetical protein